ncbi:unnamed protein product [Orchesella dallaii]|uniref:Uncharacterized protein n=1 Tax=Orchesella dallaii TaxID=48710 RepID=A0ABP1QE56_9HEXA
MPSVTGQTKTKTFESGGKSAWPLPPSSVFRCQPAPPFIDPILFYLDQNLSPLPCHTGVLVVGEVIPELDNGQEIDSFEDAEISNYLGLKGRRKGVQSIEAKPGLEVKRVKWLDKDDDEVIPSTEAKNAKSVHRNSSQNLKSRKWSPFQKDRNQSWKLFY